MAITREELEAQVSELNEELTKTPEGTERWRDLLGMLLALEQSLSLDEDDDAL